MFASSIARLLAGRPDPLLGRLLSEEREDGPPVLIDPETGGELSPSRLPAFVLSTEREATDGHILRQFWDLSRADEAGIPVLWNHDPDRLLGQWRELAVTDHPTLGRILTGRADLDTESAEASERLSQIRRGYLRAVSVRWAPGETIRRGDLDPADPLYREPQNDLCDQPAEGFVMGSERGPNHLIETSLTPIPADQRAAVTERHARAAAELHTALRGGAADVDRILGLLADDPRVRAWGLRLVRSEVERLVEQALQRLTAPSPSSLFSLLRGKNVS